MFLNIISPNAADPTGIEHIDALYSYAMVLTRNRSEVEDLVQETYVRAIKVMVNLPADGSTPDELPGELRCIGDLRDATRKNQPSCVASDKSAVSAGGDQVRSSELIFHYRNNRNFKVITWSNHGLTHALVSSLPGSAQQSSLVCHQNMDDHNTF
jgi:Sigma-70 region 2